MSMWNLLMIAPFSNGPSALHTQWGQTILKFYLFAILPYVSLNFKVHKQYFGRGKLYSIPNRASSIHFRQTRPPWQRHGCNIFLKI